MSTLKARKQDPLWRKSALIAGVISAVVSGGISFLNTHYIIESSDRSHKAELNARMQQWEKENKRSLDAIQAQDERHKKELEAFARLVELNSISIEKITGQQRKFVDEISAQAEIDRNKEQDRQSRDKVESYIRSARMLQAGMAKQKRTPCQIFDNTVIIPTLRNGTTNGNTRFSSYNSDCTLVSKVENELLMLIAEYETSLSNAVIASKSETKRRIESLDAIMRVGVLKEQIAQNPMGIEYTTLSDAELSKAIREIESSLDLT